MTLVTLLLGSDEEYEVFTPEIPNAKREIERKFSKSRPKLGKFCRFCGSGGQGFQKGAIFTPNGTSVRKFTSIKPFCVKIRLDGLTSRRVPEKSKKVT